MNTIKGKGSEMDNRQYLKPEEIYKRSFKIIQEAFGAFTAPEQELFIYTKIAHASADVEFAKTFLIAEAAVEAGINALLNGQNIITDVSMVKSGIRINLLKEYRGEVRCFLYDDDIAPEAARRGTTKSAAAMTKAADFMAGGIVAIGNAPTALFELIDLIKAGKAKPALVIGVPVGFVGAAESKQELSELDIPFITNPDKRGGSSIAAAVVNGLITLAGKSL